MRLLARSVKWLWSNTKAALFWIAGWLFVLIRDDWATQHLHSLKARFEGQLLGRIAALVPADIGPFAIVLLAASILGLIAHIVASRRSLRYSLLVPSWGPVLVSCLLAVILLYSVVPQVFRAPVLPTGVDLPAPSSTVAPTSTPAPTSTSTPVPSATTIPRCSPRQRPLTPCIWVVQAGEAFESISLAVYGNVRHALLLINYNRSPLGYRMLIRPGDEVLVPKLGDPLHPHYPSCIPFEEGSGEFPCVYGSQPGDTLASVSSRFYRLTAYSQCIRAANFTYDGVNIIPLSDDYYSDIGATELILPVAGLPCP